MTLKSRRQAAERKVIEAVRIWRQYQSDSAPLNYPWYSRSLLHAFDELVELDVELPGDAPVNTTSPLTAQQAAAWMEGERAASVAGRIVRFIWENRHDGWTVDELELALQGRHQTISARVHELRKAGWLTTDGTRTTRSGRDAEVYRLTGAANWHLKVVEHDRDL